ncbi:coiled-coil-helix-coiled-coil-helix domain containing 3a isoform X3 [Pangasianodon hypophthalmus]|uniref:coiled-coil-helix-coiled-coil-helix domain containing 3a isoform X3 n=1 Tax=Pangasianodon hypophthalmus TaxID=310915 RepID=UPI000EFFBB91|nr:coiled-coil-helix-coiled-coil-helix domain containing 3a isoform X3 [Pangasianodon hypophthalmus]
MGGSSSTRRVSFESDENENVTVVKGVRLSENVINRMREPSKPQSRSSPPPPPQTKVEPQPYSAPSRPAFDPITSLPPQIPAPPPTSPPPASAPAVDESELRRKISEEVQKGLEEERSKTQHELHQWLEKERARVKAQAHADAQAHVQDEVNRILASERAAALDSVQRAVVRERVSAEEERLRTKLLAKQLEERDQQLRKQDAFYREQLNKLEERSTQFYKVTNENYHKAADEVNAKFRRYEISPVCADLQGQILKCYRENAGKTLLCSNIASLYLQCVNSAKQNKLRTGG